MQQAVKNYEAFLSKDNDNKPPVAVKAKLSDHNQLRKKHCKSPAALPVKLLRVGTMKLQNCTCTWSMISWIR